MQYEGMGIYWGLVERLYEQDGYMNIEDLPIYANGDNSLCERITKVVRDFDLFKIKDGKFWSESCLRRLSVITEKSNKASQSAHKRWSKDTNAMPTQCEGNAIKESKGKEIKESKENKKKEGEFLYLTDPIFSSIFESYLKTRKTKATEHAKDLILKDLHKVDKVVAIAMLEQSIKNGWIGIFQIKKEIYSGKISGQGSQYAGIEREV